VTEIVRRLKLKPGFHTVESNGAFTPMKNRPLLFYFPSPKEIIIFNKRNIS